MSSIEGHLCTVDCAQLGRGEGICAVPPWMTVLSWKVRGRSVFLQRGLICMGVLKLRSPMKLGGKPVGSRGYEGMSQDRVRTRKQSGLAANDMPLPTGGKGSLVSQSQVPELLF